MGYIDAKFDLYSWDMNYDLGREIEVRWYLGKYLIGVIDRVGNKSYVIFLEDGIIGNKKVGYRTAECGEKVFLYTRNCYKNKTRD